MTEPVRLADTTWWTVRDAAYDVAVLPWGATEAHNYHLPYGTDTVEADAVAAESAGIARELGARVVVLPAVRSRTSRPRRRTPSLSSRSRRLELCRRSRWGI